MLSPQVQLFCLSVSILEVLKNLSTKSGSSSKSLDIQAFLLLVSASAKT